jgi:hypothetical protein
VCGSNGTEAKNKILDGGPPGTRSPLEAPAEIVWTLTMASNSQPVNNPLSSAEESTGREMETRDQISRG